MRLPLPAHRLAARRRPPVRRALLAPALVLLALLAPLADASPVAAAAAPTKVSSAWLPYWDLTNAYRAVVANADLIRTASPFWYAAGSCTSVTGRPGAGRTAVIDGLHARAIAVVPTIASTIGPSAAISCFGSAAGRRSHVAAVMAVVRSRRYDGIDLNYEQLALTTSPSTARRVRTAYTAFVTDVCAALRHAHKQCVVTVMPRTDDSFAVWRSKLIPAVYDYAALGAAATTLRVMAYDQHAPNTAPGPVGGYPWTAAVARYTRSRVNPGKVELGLPLYGRDWGARGGDHGLGPAGPRPGRPATTRRWCTTPGSRRRGSATGPAGSPTRCGSPTRPRCASGSGWPAPPASVAPRCGRRARRSRPPGRRCAPPSMPPPGQRGCHPDHSCPGSANGASARSPATGTVGRAGAGRQSRPPALSPTPSRCGQPDRHEGQHDQHRGDDVDHRRLVRPEQVAEDPDRQRLHARARR